MTKKKHDHDRNVRAIMAQMLTVAVIALLIIVFWLGLWFAGHWHTPADKDSKNKVNIHVSQTCTLNGNGIPIVNGKG